jgi:hypothetical protein
MCIESLYDGSTKHEFQLYSKEEIDEWIESLNGESLQKIQNFFTTLPKLKKEIEYKWVNPDDPTDTHTETIVLEGLLSFLS